jgi:GH18 family chitinase/LysM repeat protein
MLTTVKSLALGLLLCSPTLAKTSGSFKAPNLQLDSNTLLPRQTSNTTTVSQCGINALPGNENCPLNVCCSQFGNCGTTADFCGTGCQNGCDTIVRPSCEGSSSSKRTVGYYQSWADNRTCQSVSPEELNVAGYTHIYYAFLLFDPKTFVIAPADNETSLIPRFTDLKTTNPGLQTWVSIGGWAFNDPGATLTAFSDMVSSSENRSKFIAEIIHFMETYAFDGLDLDWEYPSASDRGGKPADKANYVLLTQELRAAFGIKYGLSVTLPASFYYLQNFDVASMEQHVDFFNIMAYDLHGVWEKGIAGIGIRPHTNLTEIDSGLDLLWGADVAPEKVTMGMAFYGRSYTLEAANCTTPNGICQFSAAGLPGRCSAAAGSLNLQEIEDILVEEQLTPMFDKEAAIKYTAFNKTQWVAYDDAETIRMKQAFASSRCLGGTMVWAMDEADQKDACGLPPAIRSSPSDYSAPPPSYGNTTSSSNCTSQVTVTPNTTTCPSLIAASHGNYTSAQLQAWNPTLFKSCSDLKPGTKLCTSPPGGWYVLAPPPIAPSNTNSASTNPSDSDSDSASPPPPKTQPGIASDCKTFATAKAGDTCFAFAAANKIEAAQLYEWNPVLGKDGSECATKFWAEESYCVGTTGGAANGTGGGGASSSSASTTTTSSLAAKRSVHLGSHRHGHVRHN